MLGFSSSLIAIQRHHRVTQCIKYPCLLILMIGCQLNPTRYRTIRNSKCPVSSTSEPRNLRHNLRLHGFRFSPSNFEVLGWWCVTSLLVLCVAPNETHLSPNYYHDRFSSYNANIKMTHIIKLKKDLNIFDKISSGNTFLQYVKI